MAASVPNAKLRLTGAVLVVLAVLALAGAVTGWDASGTGERIAFGVVGVVLLLVGVLLVWNKTPTVLGIRADPAGLQIEIVGQRPLYLAWASLDALRLHRLSAQFGGYTIVMRLAPGTSTPEQLRPFETFEPDGGRIIGIGLNSRQSRILVPQLQRYAKTRDR